MYNRRAYTILLIEWGCLLNLILQYLNGTCIKLTNINLLHKDAIVRSKAYKICKSIIRAINCSLLLALLMHSWSPDLLKCFSISIRTIDLISLLDYFELVQDRMMNFFRIFELIFFCYSHWIHLIIYEWCKCTNNTNATTFHLWNKA